MEKPRPERDSQPTQRCTRPSSPLFSSEIPCVRYRMFRRSVQRILRGRGCRRGDWTIEFANFVTRLAQPIPITNSTPSSQTSEPPSVTTMGDSEKGQPQHLSAER